jgi:hypothetical protein
MTMQEIRVAEEICFSEVLIPRNGETLAQLLTRLDLGIGKAFTEDVFADENQHTAEKLAPPKAPWVAHFRTVRNERLGL